MDPDKFPDTDLMQFTVEHTGRGSGKPGFTLSREAMDRLRDEMAGFVLARLLKRTEAGRNASFFTITISVADGITGPIDGHHRR